MEVIIHRGGSVLLIRQHYHTSANVWFLTVSCIWITSFNISTGDSRWGGVSRWEIFFILFLVLYLYIFENLFMGLEKCNGRSASFRCGLVSHVQFTCPLIRFVRDLLGLFSFSIHILFCFNFHLISAFQSSLTPLHSLHCLPVAACIRSKRQMLV